MRVAGLLYFTTLIMLAVGGDGSDRGIGVELVCYLVVTGYNFKRLASLFTCANT
jgi:hypothetical protein